MTALLSHAETTANEKAMRIIARSLFRELKENGYDTRQIVNLSTELIGLVNSDLRAKPEAATFANSVRPSA